MIIRIVVALILLFSIAGMMAAGAGNRFNGEYAPGATVNAIDGLIATVRSGMLALVCAIALATNEIVAAIGRLQESQDQFSRDALRRPAAKPSPAAPITSYDPPVPAPVPLGKRPGETDEQWAARVEAVEVASFKARNQK